MSIDEARRFERDLTNNSQLLAKVKSVVSGLASFVEAGKAHGYDFTLADAKQLVRDKVPRNQLSDEQLDAIAAGHGIGAMCSGGIGGSTGVAGIGGTPNVVVSGIVVSG
jgi:predicted ribosomally synthesized peptide with nif11-like leader